MFSHCVPRRQECCPVEHSSISKHSKQCSQLTGIRLFPPSSPGSPRRSRTFRWRKGRFGTHACVAEWENERTVLTVKKRQFCLIQASFMLGLNAEIILIRQFSLSCIKTIPTVHLKIGKSYPRICYSVVVVLFRIHSDKTRRY